MKTFTATIKASFTFEVEAETEEEANKLARQKIEKSRVYDEGDEFHFGRIWLYDLDDTDGGVFVLDEESNSLTIGTVVNVPDPQQVDDAWKYSFRGTVIGFKDSEKLAIIEDNEGNCFDVEVERLEMGD
jgi:hypothetical protein